MARIRSLKPEFFRHEVLARLSPTHRLLFAGLWTQADREGRLMDRPQRLKEALLPHDSCDIEKLLTDLADTVDPYDNKPFIVRYTVDGCHYIQITNFHKHQYPHIKEPKSTIPAPCKYGASMVRT